jgi:hypothetical protein
MAYHYGPVLARVERDGQGNVRLRLIKDEEEVHLEQGDEFLTVMLKGNPWVPIEIEPS